MSELAEEKLELPRKKFPFLPSFLPDERGDQIMMAIAGLGLLYVIFLLFFYERGSVTRSAQKVGVLKTDGVVKRRHAKTLHWLDVKGEGEIYLRDIVYTPKNTEATIVFNNNKSIKLEPETLVQFDEMTLDQIRITLMDGKVKGDAVQKEGAIITSRETPLFKLLPYPKMHQIRLLPEPTLIVSRYQDWAGKLKLVMQRPTKLVVPSEISAEKFTLNRLKDFEIRLVAPGQERFNLRSHPWIRVEWTRLPLKGAEYVVEVSRDEAFHRAITLKTNDNHLQVQLSDEGSYYWRVRALLNTDEAISNVGHFSMTRVGGKVPTAALQVPQEDVLGFTVDISKDEKFDQIIKTEILGKPKCKLKGLDPGIYFCRVKSLKTNKEKLYRVRVKENEEDN